MRLKDFVEKTEQSDRLIVIDQDERELYKGYAANFHGEKGEREVEKICLYTEVYKRGESTKWIENIRPTGEEIPLKNTGNYRFADLEIRIYTKVVLKDESKDRAD